MIPVKQRLCFSLSLCLMGQEGGTRLCRLKFFKPMLTKISLFQVRIGLKYSYHTKRLWSIRIICSLPCVAVRNARTCITIHWPPARLKQVQTLNYCSGGSRPGVWGGGQIRGRQKVFTCLNAPDSLWQSLGIAQKLLPFIGQENGNFVGQNYVIFQGNTTV